MGKMDQMLSMFKKKEDPYADLSESISEETKGTMGKEEVESILKEDDNLEGKKHPEGPEVLN